MKKLFLLGLVLFMLVPSAFAASDYSDAIFYYVGDDLATDVSGNGNDGTLVGTVYNSSACILNDSCLSFDGYNDYLEFSSFTDDDNAYGISFWYDPTRLCGSTAGGEMVLSLYTDGSNRWHLQRQSDANGIQFFGQTGGSIVSDYNGGCSFTSNDLEFYVFNSNGDGTSTLYINDVQVTTLNLNLNSLVSATRARFGTYADSATPPTAGSNFYAQGTYGHMALWENPLNSTRRAELYNNGTGFNPFAATPQTYFNVQAQDADTLAALSNITITLENGTTYTNASSTIVYTPFNDSRLLNFTVSVDNYFNQTFTNYNTSVDLTANLTQWAKVGFYNIWNNESLDGFVYTGVTGIVNNAADDWNNGFTSYSDIYTITDGVAYLPINSSTTIAVSFKQAIFDSFASQYLYFVDGNIYKPQFRTHDFTNSNDINVSTFQAEVRFNASSIISNQTVPSSSFTINGVSYSSDESVYINNGVYNVTFSKNGFTNSTQEITISSENGTGSNINKVKNYYNQTVTFTNVYDNTVTLNLSNYYNASEIINNFTVYLSNSTYGYTASYSTTNGTITFNTVNNLLLDITFQATGYHNTTYENYNTSLNLSGQVFPTDEIGLRFYSASTGEFLNQTVNVTAENSSTQLTYSILQGSDFVSGLIQGLSYLFNAQTSGFTEGTYNREVPVPTLSSPYMDFYLLESAQNTTFTISNTAGSAIEGALVEIEKFVNGTYQLVASQTTDITGNAYLALVLADTHKVTISATGYRQVQFVVPSLQSSYSITLQSNESLNLDYYYGSVYRDFTPKTPYINVSEGIIPISVVITSSLPILDYAGFKIINLSNPNQVLYEFNSTANQGGTFTYDLNITNMSGQKVALIYYFKIEGYSRTTQQFNYFIVNNLQYTGTLSELRDKIDIDLSEAEKIFYFALTFILSMIILAVFVRGIANVALSLGLALIAGFIFSINMFIIGTIALILFIAIIGLSRSTL